MQWSSIFLLPLKNWEEKRLRLSFIHSLLHYLWEAQIFRLRQPDLSDPLPFQFKLLSLEKKKKQ